MNHRPEELHDTNVEQNLVLDSLAQQPDFIDTSKISVGAAYDVDPRAAFRSIDAKKPWQYSVEDEATVEGIIKALNKRETDETLYGRPLFEYVIGERTVRPSLALRIKDNSSKSREEPALRHENSAENPGKVPTPLGRLEFEEIKGGRHRQKTSLKEKYFPKFGRKGKHRENTVAADGLAPQAAAHSRPVHEAAPVAEPAKPSETPSIVEGIVYSRELNEGYASTGQAKERGAQPKSRMGLTEQIFFRIGNLSPAMLSRKFSETFEGLKHDQDQTTVKRAAALGVVATAGLGIAYLSISNPDASNDLMNQAATAGFLGEPAMASDHETMFKAKLSDAVEVFANIEVADPNADIKADIADAETKLDLMHEAVEADRYADQASRTVVLQQGDSFYSAAERYLEAEGVENPAAKAGILWQDVLNTLEENGETLAEGADRFMPVGAEFVISADTMNELTGNVPFAEAFEQIEAGEYEAGQSEVEATEQLSTETLSVTAEAPGITYHIAEMTDVSSEQAYDIYQTMNGEGYMRAADISGVDLVTLPGGEKGFVGFGEATYSEEFIQRMTELARKTQES